MRSQISATTISHHWKNAQPPPRRALAGSSSSYARHCLQPPPGKQDTKQAKYPRTVGGLRFFFTKWARFWFQKLSLRPRTLFFALFSKMKVPGPDSLILTNAVFMGFHASRPASRPAGPAGPASPTWSTLVNGQARPLV